MLASVGALSPPMTFAAIPWIADHGLPHIPDRGFDLFREAWEVCGLMDLSKEDAGTDAPWKRDEEAAPEFEAGVGDPFLDTFREELLLGPPSLSSVA